MTAATALEQRIRQRYDVVTEELMIAGEEFSILRVRDSNQLVDRIDPAAFARDERLPYWADLWSSSLALASACLTEFGLHGKRILELGCGLGLAGIAAARAGARVTLTDYEEDALLFADYNRMINLSDPAARASCSSRILDWRTPGSTESYDVVLGADIIYDEKDHLPLLTLLEQCLEPSGCAYFTDPGRRTAPLFSKLAVSRGFLVQARAASPSPGPTTTPQTCLMLRRTSTLPRAGASA